MLTVIIMGYFYTVLGPQQQIREQRASKATADAVSLRITEEAQQKATTTALQNEQAELERQYAAALVFQETGDWQAAADSLREVIRRDAGYKEAAQRLDAVLARLGEEAASATAVVAGETATAQAQSQATGTLVAQQTAQSQANATSTALAAPSTTAETLAKSYQRAEGLISLQRWAAAEAELMAVFDVDPTYQEVQSLLATVSAETAKLPPTPTPTIMPTPTRTLTPSPTATL